MFWKRNVGWLLAAMVVNAAPAAANHDVTTPQRPGLSGPEVLYVLAKDRYTVIDPGSLKALTTVKVGGCFLRLAPTGDGKLVYASNPCLNAVVVIDAASHKVVDMVKVGEGPGGEMLLSPDWKVVWVRTLDGVSAIDAASHKYLTHIATGNAKSPFGGPGAFSGMASVPPDAGRPNLLYVANPKDNSVTAIDADRRAAVATIPVGTEPRAMAYSRFSGKVYVLNARSRDVSVIDPSAQKVVKTIAVPQSGLGAIGFMHNGRFATIDSRHARGGGDSLVVISAETDSVVGTITLHSEGTPTPDPVNPSRVYFTPDDKLGFAIHKTSPHLSVVDVEKLKLVKLIKLEPRNKDVYYRCSVLVAQDGKTAYLTSMSDQTLTAVDVATLTVRAVIDTKAPTCAVYNFRTAGSPH